MQTDGRSPQARVNGKFCGNQGNTRAVSRELPFRNPLLPGVRLMRYFVPDIKLLPKIGEPSPISVSKEQLGGVPFGLPRERWPKCRECGKSQSLLAQFEHHPFRIDLGRGGRMLYVFECAHDPGMCATWEPFSGANACIVVEPDAFTGEPTAVPGDTPPVHRGVVIAGWVSREDTLSQSDANAFLNEQAFLELAPEKWRQATYSTRLGGVPCWLQSADEAPRPDWLFIGQLDNTYSFLTAPAAGHDWISIDKERFEGRTHYAQGPNFGDGGIAYLFTRHNEVSPEVCMLWQCL
jgi:hypothetical protein